MPLKQSDGATYLVDNFVSIATPDDQQIGELPNSMDLLLAASKGDEGAKRLLLKNAGIIGVEQRSAHPVKPEARPRKKLTGIL